MKPRNELVEMKDDSSMGRWDWERAVEDCWWQSLRDQGLEDDEDEWYWGGSDARHAYWREAAHSDRVAGISDVRLRGRQNDTAGLLVDRALQKWEEGRRKEEDRIIAQTWELLSENGDLSDDGWADD